MHWKATRNVSVAIAACAIGVSACSGGGAKAAGSPSSPGPSSSPRSPGPSNTPSSPAPAAGTFAPTTSSPHPATPGAATSSSGVTITVTKTQVAIPNGKGAKASMDQPTVTGVPTAVTTTLRDAATQALASFGARIPQLGCAGTSCSQCSPACATPSFTGQWISGRADQGIVSGRWVFTAYYPGAAHPYDADQSLIVDARTGRAIDPWALFAGAGLTPLADAAKPLLQNALATRDGCAVASSTFAQQMFDSGVAPKADNYQAVAVVSSGLAVATSSGQISSYACGGFHVVVAWSNVRDSLSPLGQAIASGQSLPQAQASGPSASGAAACQDGQVVVSVLKSPATGAAGLSHQGVLLQFTPIDTSACTLYGYPGVAGLDANGKQVLQATRTASGYLGGLRGGNPGTVTITELSPASAWVEGSSAQQTGQTCPSIVALLVTPPGLHNPAQVETAPSACDGLQVHPVVAGITGDR